MSTPAATLDSATDTALRRYRVVAYLVGVVLLVLVLVGIPLRYGADTPIVSLVVSPIHGFVLYPLYLVMTFQLGRRVGWTLARTVLVMLAGTVPFLSFVIERRVTRSVQAGAGR